MPQTVTIYLNEEERTLLERRAAWLREHRPEKYGNLTTGQWVKRVLIADLEGARERGSL